MRNPIIVGERGYLRSMEASDADQFARDSAAETETFMDRGRFPTSPLAFAHWIEETTKADLPRNIQFAVCLKVDDRCIGGVGLHGVDYVNRTAETGSGLTRAEFRGRGYGTEAKHLLLEYAFDRLHLHALFSHVWEPNTRSAAALAKQGYRPAGRLKWDDLKDGVYRDTLVFDLLREEWLAARETWRARSTRQRASDAESG